MSTSEKPRLRVPAGSAPTADRLSTLDSYQNFEARIGIGTDNLASASQYGFNPVTRNRLQLEWMYRGSAIVGRIVDTPAEDMVRAGIDLGSTLPPDDGEAIKAGLQRRGVWKAIESTLKWSRLYGGAIGVLLIDGQHPATPLRPETVGPGQFKGILVLDRWMVQPTLTETVQELGPDLGQPKYYIPNANAPALSGRYVHYSRVIRFDGVELPFWQAQAENGWGASVVERLYDRLVAFDSTTQGTAQLVYRAHLRVLQIEGLVDILGMGGPALEVLAKRVEAIRRFQSIEGITLIDAKDKFEALTYQFSGLPDVLARFAEQLSMASGIPLVILFGQSPAGFSSGESDIRNYYDGINAQQESRLRPGLARILDVLARSETGRPLPEGFEFSFEPLWQMSDKEKADVAKTVTDTVLGAKEAGVVSDRTALKELRQSSDVTGVWSNITDADIEAADDTIPLPSELDPVADPADGPTTPEGRPDVPALSLAA
ncbi:DUF1073 domain-containing protein [Methylobacterium sp. CCH5-D2]|uniref:DUF1073 domain-containing protein n=1 Tax=Methylobacterium sp. CCH5-D2 TaxID=1768765 RepID=UPI0009E678BE|nr:DUF1073 domain-containing protein [Methylobacterium sp. CCH5-D2]